MTEILTSEQMRAVEDAAFAAGVDSLSLMERAGRETLKAILDAWPELATGVHHAVILAGPGNNGGDGYVIARRLADRGWRVEVLALGDTAKMPPDARRNREAWEGMGEVRPFTPATGADGDRPDLLVDALFGIGLSRPLSDDLIRARNAVSRRLTGADRCRKAAVDCVSGLDGDTGGAHPEKLWFQADLTVTGHRAKLGHYLGLGYHLSGRLAVRDIGIDAHDRPEPPLNARPTDGRVRLVDGRCRGADETGRWISDIVFPGAMRHKYDRGHVVVLSGGPGKGGAARLAARAALRAGAGLVTLACPPAALQENASRVDAVMTRSLKDAAALEEMLADARIGAVVLGPGLGPGESTRAMVRAALTADRAADEDERRAAVLDADALTAFADDPLTLFADLHPRAVLTPHEGEFARLFPDLAERGRDGSKVDAARAAADRAGCTVLLKGEATVIASPDGAASLHAALYDREAPWLATAGAGDVLAGIVGALSCRVRSDVHLAAEAAAWLHVEAAREFGPGLIAEDLPEMLPAVFRRLGL